MKNCRSLLWLFWFALMFTVATTANDAPPLTFTFIKSNVPGATQTEPSGISNAGVIVGAYYDKKNVLHGYILNGKKLTTLDDPKGTQTFASNLYPNGAVVVVGYYIAPSGNQVGFLYKNGKFTDIPGPRGAIASAGIGINDSGEAVGDYVDAREATHGFLLKGKTYTTLDVPGATASFATGINDKGDIVLSWIDSKGNFESSLYNGKTYHTINVPGATNSLAEDINKEGDVIYGWIDSKNVNHGALLHAGKYYKFDYPKSVYSYGGGINDKNKIVGGYKAKTNGPLLGFEATYK